MNWKHPTGGNPKIVTLIALGPSQQEYIAANMANDLSDAVLGVDEIWSLNRGGMYLEHDLLFVMDNIQGEADKNPRYGAALWKHKKPIITSDNYERWPGHVVGYPLLEIWDWLRKSVNPMHGDWFHNSLAYILVYAAFIGVKELRVFGADYHSHSSGVVEDGHPCVAYWTGKLESTGLVVKPSAGSAFLNANQRHWIYGYRDDPRKIPANRGRFRAMVGIKADPESMALLSGERQVGETIDEIQPDHKYRYEWASHKVYGRVLDIGGGIGYGSFILSKSENVQQVMMFERSSESISYAHDHYRSEKIRYIEKDLDGSEIEEVYSGDCAVAFEIIEHLSNPLPLLKSLPAKWLLASVPNENVIPYSPETAQFHQRHYTLEQFEQLLKEAGWNVTNKLGQTDPFSKVVEYSDKCRTLIVEAHRCDSLNGKGKDG